MLISIDQSVLNVVGVDTLTTTTTGSISASATTQQSEQGMIRLAFYQPINSLTIANLCLFYSVELKNDTIVENYSVSEERRAGWLISQCDGDDTTMTCM